MRAQSRKPRSRSASCTPNNPLLAVNRSRSPSVRSDYSERPKTTSCQCHVFGLRPLPGHQTFFKHEISLSFGHFDSNKKPCMPAYLADLNGLCHMPCFGSSYERDKYASNKDKMLRAFEDQVEQQCIEKEPRTPRPNHDYCQVCSGKFQNYDAHVSSRAHREAVINSSGTRFIYELMEKWERRFEYTEEEESLMEDLRSFNAGWAVTEKLLVSRKEALLMGISSINQEYDQLLMKAEQIQRQQPSFGARNPSRPSRLA